jgi:hypothetical protein
MRVLMGRAMPRSEDGNPKAKPHSLFPIQEGASLFPPKQRDQQGVLRVTTPTGYGLYKSYVVSG